MLRLPGLSGRDIPVSAGHFRGKKQAKTGCGGVKKNFEIHRIRLSARPERAGLWQGFKGRKPQARWGLNAPRPRRPVEQRMGKDIKRTPE